MNVDFHSFFNTKILQPKKTPVQFSQARDLLLSKKLKNSESAAFRGIGHTSKESATHQTFGITYLGQYLGYLEIRGIGHTSKESATLHWNRPHFIGIGHTTFDNNIQMHLFIDQRNRPLDSGIGHRSIIDQIDNRICQNRHFQPSKRQMAEISRPVPFVILCRRPL